MVVVPASVPVIAVIFAPESAAKGHSIGIAVPNAIKTTTIVINPYSIFSFTLPPLSKFLSLDRLNSWYYNVIIKSTSIF